MEKSIFTERHKTRNELNDHVLKELCNFGKGKDCCRYISCDGEGYECQKLTASKYTIDELVESDQMIAQGTGCNGVTYVEANMKIEDIELTQEVSMVIRTAIQEFERMLKDCINREEEKGMIEIHSGYIKACEYALSLIINSIEKQKKGYIKV